jgi:hypothetical protein
MSQTIEIRYTRSKEFCQEEAIRTGQSVPAMGSAVIQVEQLTADNRRAIIQTARTGNYPTVIRDFLYNASGEIHFDAYRSYGVCPIEMDTMNPSATEINLAIADAYYFAGARLRVAKAKIDLHQQIEERERELEALRRELSQM